jgi:cation diffusion facilitator CzcD-associated flavoprotein CzcO
VTDGRETYGIDLLIPRGVALEDLVVALQSVARLPAEAIVRPGDDEAARGLAIYGYPVWAAIHSYPSGEIAWKADLGAKTPRDHVAIGRFIAQRLGTPIVIMTGNDNKCCLLGRQETQRVATPVIYARPRVQLGKCTLVGLSCGRRPRRSG